MYSKTRNYRGGVDRGGGWSGSVCEAWGGWNFGGGLAFVGGDALNLFVRTWGGDAILEMVALPWGGVAWSHILSNKRHP